MNSAFNPLDQSARHDNLAPGASEAQFDRNELTLLWLEIFAQLRKSRLTAMPMTAAFVYLFLRVGVWLP